MGITFNKGTVSVSAEVSDVPSLDWLIDALKKVRDVAFPPEPVFDLVMRDCGERKINVIKEIRDLNGMTLKDAKDTAETPGAKILLGKDETSCQHAAMRLAEQGATVSILAGGFRYEP